MTGAGIGQHGGTQAAPAQQPQASQHAAFACFAQPQPFFTALLPPQPSQEHLPGSQQHSPRFARFLAFLPWQSQVPILPTSSKEVEKLYPRPFLMTFFTFSPQQSPHAVGFAISACFTLASTWASLTRSTTGDRGQAMRKPQPTASLGRLAGALRTSKLHSLRMMHSDFAAALVGMPKIGQHVGTSTTSTRMPSGWAPFLTSQGAAAFWAGHSDETHLKSFLR